jgi:thioredoxin reductase
MPDLIAVNRYDVIIIGAGPAGLSAALILGRACRRVLICDRGTPRSWAAKQMHAFLSREGIAPQKFRDIAKAELDALGGVEYRNIEATAAERSADNTFTVHFDGGDSQRSSDNTSATARKLLLATGVFDCVPEIEGIGPLFGTSVFQCPYCDGWEFRAKPIAVYGRGQPGFEMCRAITAWTTDIALCSDGPSSLSAREKRQLRGNGIRLIESPIAKLVGTNGQLERIIFTTGAVLDRAALFFDTRSRQQSALAAQLGCQFTRQGKIKAGQYEATTVPGLFAAGNIIQDVQLSIVAAAEGARAAFGINRSLTREDFDRNSRSARHCQSIS